MGVVELEDRHHVLHMGGDVYRLAGTEVGPVAHARQGGGETSRPQPQAFWRRGPLQPPPQDHVGRRRPESPSSKSAAVMGGRHLPVA